MHLAVGADQFDTRFALIQRFGEHCRDALRCLKIVLLTYRKDELNRIHRRAVVTGVPPLPAATKSPTLKSVRPTMPSIGELIVAKARFNSALSSAACADAAAACAAR